MVGVGQPVVAVDVDQGRLVLGRLGFVADAVGADDDQVARLRAVRGGAVDRDHAAALFAADRVGDEALAVVDVVDVDLLVLADAGDVEQAAVDGARAFVVQLGVGDGGAVDLGLEDVQLHGWAPAAGLAARRAQV